jgi:hypothetical protein
MCILTLSVLFGGVTAASIGSALGASAATAGAVGIGALAAETIGVAATIGGGIASTIGGIQQQKAIAAQAEFQADVAEENAKIAAQSAEANELQANQKRLALFNRMQQMQGQMRTDFAGRGVVLGSGTQADYEADLADSYDLDKRNLNYDTATRTWQYRVEEASNRQQADLYRAQAKGARSLIPGVAAGGLLSTAGGLINSAMGSFSLGTELGVFGKGASSIPKDGSGFGFFPAKPKNNLTWGSAPTTGFRGYGMVL